jgi:RNA polymerase sigma factor (sigma-70 family)
VEIDGAASNEMNEQEEGRVLDEQKCICAAMAGNHDAYGELVSTYQSMVYRVCLKMTGNRDAAEDLAQEVFLKAYHALPGFRQDASFSTWLYQITVRKCLDWRRSMSRERQKVSAVAVEDTEWLALITPEQSLVEKERFTELLLIVNGLREPYRTVTKMFYLDERSCQEIAEQTGTPVKTIESQLYRARRLMREKGGRCDELYRRSGLHGRLCRTGSFIGYLERNLATHRRLC